MEKTIMHPTMPESSGVPGNLEPFGLEVVSQREAGFCQDVEETGTTFAEKCSDKGKGSLCGNALSGHRR